MLTPTNKVLTFSNVKWIDNASALANNNQVSLLPSSKRQCLPSTSTLELQRCDASTSTHDALTEVFSLPRANSPIESITSSLSSAPESPSFKSSSLVSTPITSSPPIIPLLRPVTKKLAKKIRAENPDLQEAPLDSLALLALLSVADSPKPTEPKTYKKAVSERNFYHKDWKRAMQEEIDSVNENETWILTDLPIGTIALDGKWVYKIKRGPNGEITRYKA